MKPPKLLRTVYLRAIEVLRKRGWYQGALSNGYPDGPVCMVGAIHVVLTGDPWCERVSSHNELGKCLTAVTGARLNGDWNDDDDRTEREVFAALRKAAKLAGNKRVSP